jgi:hypothetical protein
MYGTAPPIRSDPHSIPDAVTTAGSAMSDKSPRQSASKKSDKSIKQKRAMKKAKKAAAEKPS